MKLQNESETNQQKSVSTLTTLDLACDAFTLSFAEAIEEPKKLLDMSDSQGFMNPVVYTHQRHAVFVSLVPDIGSY